MTTPPNQSPSFPLSRESRGPIADMANTGEFRAPEWINVAKEGNCSCREGSTGSGIEGVVHCIAEKAEGEEQNPQRQHGRHEQVRGGAKH